MTAYFNFLESKPSKKVLSHVETIADHGLQHISHLLIWFGQNWKVQKKKVQTKQGKKEPQFKKGIRPTGTSKDCPT